LSKIKIIRQEEAILAVELMMITFNSKLEEMLDDQLGEVAKAIEE
jgi:hypothetical protein